MQKRTLVHLEVKTRNIVNRENFFKNHTFAIRVEFAFGIATQTYSNNNKNGNWIFFNFQYFLIVRYI